LLGCLFGVLVDAKRDLVDQLTCSPGISPLLPSGYARAESRQFGSRGVPRIEAGVSKRHEPIAER
jgi:hypothetical protein